jgi:hypothetical protein
MLSTPIAATTPAPLAAPCAATTRDGRPCRFPTRPGHPLCINHDPAFRDKQRANRAAGVSAATDARRRRARLRANTALYDLDQWALVDRASIQAVLDAVIRLELAGRLPNNRARNLIRALGIAVRNFDEPGGGPGKPRVFRHNLNRYRYARQTIDANLEALCSEADRRDEARNPR